MVVGRVCVPVPRRCEQDVLDRVLDAGFWRVHGGAAARQQEAPEPLQ